MKYLVKMTPIGQYSFGNEQGFKYPGETETGKESYLVRSEEIPEQTTILGLLRYLVLQSQGFLKTDFHYTPEQQKKMEKYIGARSFSFQTKEIQDFGYIQKISPVFLVNEKEEILIRNPYHNKASKKGYEPIQMEEEIIETSAGKIIMPKIGEYNAKNGYANGYYNLTTGDIEQDLFKTYLMSGNRKNDRKDSDKECYFKRELKTLKEGYSFAVFADVTELPANTIAYMGKKKSVFLVESKEVQNINLKEMVEACFKSSNDVWYYALSDLMIEQSVKYDTFCIVEQKYQRNLETVYKEQNHLQKLKKSEIRYNLIQRGSVFYQNCNLNLSNPNHTKIGYNKIAKLGGN